MSRPQAEEVARQRALARYAVLDTPPEQGFDDLAELARTLAGCAGSGIGFLDRDRVWFKTASGFDARECDRQAFPIERGTSASEPRAEGGTDPVITGTRPVVLGELEFAFCAGAPIVTGEGYLLGELFVIDPVARELTERQRAGLAMLARQAQAALELRRTLLSYHAVVDGVGHVVFQVDERHRLVSVTPTWGRLTGFGVVRSVGRPLVEFVHRDDRERVEEQLSDLARADRAGTFECRMLRLLGGDVPVEVIARPLVDESDQRRGLVGVIADISERKAREVEAQHAQKLEALGRLSAGLAHEINTPIQFVGDNTRFLAEAYGALSGLVGTYRNVLTEHGLTDLPARSQQAIRQAEEEADIDFISQEIPSAIQQSLDGLARVATLVRAMRTFSHPGRDRQAPADLNEALEAAVIIAQNQISLVADIECELADIPPVMCTIGDLNQVFLNLLVNAVDAITDTGERGTITISTRLDGDDVIVAITDTGTGIPEEVALRVFEPFFTTKPVGQGTGQGLALARAVVHDKHGGRITLTSRVGHGSTFVIALPVSGRRTPSADSGSPT